MPIKKVVIPPTNETEGTILQHLVTLGTDAFQKKKLNLAYFFQVGFKRFWGMYKLGGGNSNIFGMFTPILGVS